MNTFKGYIIRETDGKFKGAIESIPMGQLPDNPVLVKVHYSALNYKDALSSSGHKGITREFPHVPGIDAAGEIAEDYGMLKKGQKVIVTSYDLGMNTWGGFGEYIRVPEEWVIPLPDGLSLEESMIIGTAGLTAGMALHEIMEAKVTPDMGPIAVTGSTGGVGSIAVRLLAKAGFNVAAITGKTDEKASAFLKGLGATEIIARSEFEEENKRPMLKGRFGGVIDTVGGTILSNLIKSTAPYGCVTVSGLVSSADIPGMTVYPFILRGIHIVGIESAEYPMAKRLAVWKHLAGDWKAEGLTDMVEEVALEQIGEKISAMLRGESFGRVLVRVM